ncbi:S41 family peptidase [Xanthomonas tesorieronis]|uniref:S41 family peptidase n=1 Tax=Xanthomonas tesorieronis TaxID=3160839 RepID=UPI00351100DF
MNTKFLLVLLVAIACMAPHVSVNAAEAEALAPAPAGEVAADVVRADFATLYRTLREAHFDLYAHRPKADYDRAYRTMTASIRGPMTPVAVATLFQKFVAYGRIGHARIDAPIVAFVTHLQGGGTLVPLFVRVDGDKVLLTEPAEASGTLRAGVEITAIDGVPIHAVLDRLSAYVSAERPYMAFAQMEESFPALLWLDRGVVASVSVTATIAGQSVTVPVPAVTLDQRKALDARYPNPGLATDFAARDYRVVAPGIAYLRPGPFFNSEPGADDGSHSYRATAFLAFIDDSFRKLIAGGASDLIIDLRNNPGGDNSFSDPMVAWFATRPFRFASSFTLKASAATKADYARLRTANAPIDPDFARQMEAETHQPNGTRYRYELPLVQPRPAPRYQGRVWVLVNRHSYSNAASTAALVQDYGFGKVIGEETADVASNYASVQSFTLPGTKLSVTYPKSHFIRPNGKDEVARVRLDFPIGRPPVTSADDVVLSQALAIVRQR